MTIDMDDKELDKLITASLERQQTIETLNQVIVKDIRRRARRQQIRRWTRLVAFSFGMPLLLLLFGLGIYVAATQPSLAHLRFVLLIPLLVTAYFTKREIRNFSIIDV